MLRSLFVGTFLFISVFYFAFPLHARFRQPVWGNVASSVSRKPQSSSAARERLMEQFRRWEGVRYQWGGTGADGIDCSALTQKVYSVVLKRRLPRTTGEQIKLGKPVSASQLQPGDLIFFRPKKSVRHVGIYMGNRQFMHASGSLGVTLSSLETPYWTSHFETARRIAG